MSLDSVLRNNIEAVQLIENATFIKSKFGIEFSLALIKNIDNTDNSDLIESLKRKLRDYDRLVVLNDNFIFVVFSYSSMLAAKGAISRMINEFPLIKAVSVEVDAETDIEGNILILLSQAFLNDLGDLT